MENSETAFTLSKLITVLISGIFGLVVAVITWILANFRENKKFKRDFEISKLNEIKELYIFTLTSIDKTIRATRKLKDYDKIDDEFSFLTSKLNILASNEVNQKMKEVSDLIFIWSSEYRSGMPKRLGDSNFVTVSIQDKEHLNKSKDYYPIMMEKINELVELIKYEIKQIEKRL